jgi:hypothetical protein
MSASYAIMIFLTAFQRLRNPATFRNRFNSGEIEVARRESNQ